jgi:hypothetical protein
MAVRCEAVFADNVTQRVKGVWRRSIAEAKLIGLRAAKASGAMESSDQKDLMRNHEVWVRQIRVSHHSVDGANRRQLLWRINQEDH